MQCSAVYLPVSGFQSHREKPLVVVNLDEKLLEEVVAEGVDHHHGQVGKGLHEDGRHSIVFAGVPAGVSVGRSVAALVQLLLQQPAPHLERAADKGSNNNSSSGNNGDNSSKVKNGHLLIVSIV